MDSEPKSGTTIKFVPSQVKAVQSRILTWIVTCLLVIDLFAIANVQLGTRTLQKQFLTHLLISLIFGSIVWLLHAATPAGTITGTLICLLILSPKQGGYPGLAALVALFLLSFLSTRVGRSRKESMGLAESRRGRRSSQIIANLGAAALFASAGYHTACIAALAEAAADTASSEIGQAVRGRPRLITSWKPVPAGTDGAISIEGTLAGVLAAAVVTIVGTVFHQTPAKIFVIFLCACVGLIFDSILGATLERGGWLGNDLVNFLSTVVSGLLAIWTTQ